MIIFLDEERAYLAWLKSHRAGFVLEATRKHPTGKGLLHRATCATIRTGKHRHWTTGQRLKACATDRDQLTNWARGALGKEPVLCETCSPTADLHTPAIQAHPARLTPLASNVLNYVLETTVVHLTHRTGEYRLSIGDVAACLHKSPAQLTQAIQRLAAAGLLHVVAHVRREGSLPARCLLRPTPTALRMLEGYADASDAALQEVLQRLDGRQGAVPTSAARLAPV